MLLKGGDTIKQTCFAPSPEKSLLVPIYMLLDAHLGTVLTVLLGTRLPALGTSSAWLVQEIHPKQALPKLLPEVLIPSCCSSLTPSSLPLGLS